MKRIIAAAVLSLLLAFSAAAQEGHFGITGGANFHKVRFDDIRPENVTGFHAGVTYRQDIALGFSIAPAVEYSVKGSKIAKDNLQQSMALGFVEVPVALQWGPDLLVFKPYVEVVPYIGYALTKGGEARKGDEALYNIRDVDWREMALNRTEYGVGVGGGIQVWHLQVSCRYSWSFGALSDMTRNNVWKEPLKESFGEKNFQGVSLSVAFFF